MSRGWESKDVESQIAEGRRDHRTHQPLSPEERARQQRMRGLELSRTRVLSEIEATGSPIRRAALEDALKVLERQLESLRAARS